MRHYIGIKHIKAEPQEKDGKPGYKVIYSDGYESWSPMAAFEEAYVCVGLSSGARSHLEAMLATTYNGAVEAHNRDQMARLCAQKKEAATRDGWVVWPDDTVAALSDVVRGNYSHMSDDYIFVPFVMCDDLESAEHPYEFAVELMARSAA